MAVLGTATFTADDSSRRVGPRGLRNITGNLTFGDGASTYPAGGIPLPVPVPPTGGMGLTRKLFHLIILDANNNDGVLYKWDATTNTIRMYHTTNETAVSSGTTAYRDGVEYQTTDIPANGIVLKCLVQGY